MKKYVLVLLLLVSLLLIGCDHDTNHASSYSGTVIKKSKEVVAFKCSSLEGNTLLDDGSWITEYYCAMSKDVIYLFKVNLDSSSSSGRTTKCVKKGGAIFDIVASDVDSRDWKSVCSYCDAICKSADSSIVISMGVSDTDSKNEDGSYKWYDDFMDLVNDVSKK